MSETMTVTFRFEKDTKNTRRFTEDVDGPPVIGTLYVQTWAAKKLGGGKLPERVSVTIMAGDNNSG